MSTCLLFSRCLMRAALNNKDPQSFKLSVISRMPINKPAHAFQAFEREGDGVINKWNARVFRLLFHSSPRDILKRKLKSQNGTTA